jgi:signal transduction histidine kinase
MGATPGPDVGLKRILLLLEQKENQSLLAEELGAIYEVIDGADESALEEEFDLCIVDGPCLDKLERQVRERKDREQPVFLPVLLVTARPGVKLITRQLWRLVDDLIIAPIEKPELRARVEVLLRGRSLSLALRQRAEEALHAARTRDEVLAMVSHDLRNPLNLVLTNVWLLLEAESPLPPGPRQQVDMIRRAADHMHRLIQDLLDLSGIEAGQFAVEALAEAPASLVFEACTLLEHEAEARGVDLQSAVSENLPDVCADRGRILQLFGNLIGNALKFTPEGGSIRISAELAGDAVEFAVADSGSGIPAADLPHVFDRFWQGPTSRSKGAGLGLAIARGIVASHRGEIRAESEPGRGSTFLFTIPLA